MKNRNKSGDEPSFRLAEEEPVNKLSYDHHSSGSGNESETSTGNGYESETSTSSSSNTSCSDDDNKYHGFVMENNMIQRVPFKGTPYNVIAFVHVTDTKSITTTNNDKYFDDSIHMTFPKKKNGSTAIRLVHAEREEEDKWITMENELPLFLEQVIFKGDSVDLQKNTIQKFYKAMDAWGGVGQWRSKDGKLIVGRNTVQGAANELYCGGHINEEMYDDLFNDTSLNGQFIVYFIDVINRQIGFFYRSIGCTWTNKAPGLVARKLVKGYDSLRRKRKKRKRDRSDTGGGDSSRPHPRSGTGRGRGSHSSGKRSRSGRDAAAVDGGIVREKIKPVITMNDVSSSGKRSRSGRDAAGVEGVPVDFNFVQGAALAAASAVTATESSRSHPIDTENRRMIAQPRDNDVLFGRGRQWRNHQGNLRFHRYINRYRQEYVEARKLEKAGIARHVIHAVKQPERVHTKVLPGGRFLKKVVHTTKVHHNPNQVYWVEVTTDIALEKICHAMRDRELGGIVGHVDTPSDEDINAAVHDATAAVEVVVHDADASSPDRPSGSRPRPGTGGHGSRSSGPQSRSNTLKENAGNNGAGNSLSIGLATSKKRKPSQAYVRKPSIDMKKKKTNSRTAAATVVSSSSWEYNPEAYVFHASDMDKQSYDPEEYAHDASGMDKQSYNPQEYAHDASGMDKQSYNPQEYAHDASGMDKQSYDPEEYPEEYAHDASGMDKQSYDPEEYAHDASGMDKQSYDPEEYPEEYAHDASGMDKQSYDPEEYAHDASGMDKQSYDPEEYPEEYAHDASGMDKQSYDPEEYPEEYAHDASGMDKQSYDPEESAYDASGMETDYNFAELRAKLSDSTQDF